jgi:2,4-dienoyl-CoA reductase-like NADH-dependent reductase (Old Yellow Enzyme family)/thioredoxin reductase
MGNMALKNRMVMPPMVVRYADDGYVTDRGISYYEARARGGTGLIIQEATYVHPRGQIMANQPGISDDKFIPRLSELVRAVHRHGAKIAIQLVHTGRLAYLPAGEQGLAPSAIAATGYAMPKEMNTGFAIPKEMNKDEIAEVIEYFAEAAVRAKRAGYDGIEVHGAHNYLIDQFISPASNHRKDEYGGSVENRARFLVQVIEAVREATGNDFPVWCRINGREFGVPGGETLEDAKKVARLAENAGAVAIHVSAFGPTSLINLTTPIFTPAIIAELAAGIKSAVGVPVIAVGRMTPEAGEELLSQGKADLVSFGRAIFADSEMANKVCEGRQEEIRPCILCFRCRDDLRFNPVIGIGCSVNAAMGKEASCQITKASKSKKVLVVGGGPAGMEAARVAASRGHQVSLWEKEPSLGGQLKAACAAPHKDSFGTLVPYFVAELKNLGVKVKLSMEATPEKIIQLAPDALVVATGGMPAAPEIPGLEKLCPVQAVDVLLGKSKTGNNVVVMGGELVASEVAEFLAANGKKVTMVRRGPEMAQKVSPSLRGFFLERLKNAGISMLNGVTYDRATEEGLVITTKDGERKTIEADTIVLAVGAVSEQRLYQEVKGRVAEIYLIGDSVSPRRIGEAITEGFQTGLAI